LANVIVSPAPTCAIASRSGVTPSLALAVSEVVLTTIVAMGALGISTELFIGEVPLRHTNVL
jgi:hypothetical protein